MSFVDEIDGNEVWTDFIDAYGYDVGQIKYHNNFRNFREITFPFLLKLFYNDLGDVKYSDIPLLYRSYDEDDPENQHIYIRDFIMDVSDRMEYIGDFSDGVDNYDGEGFRMRVVRFGDEYYAHSYYESSFGNSGYKEDELFNSIRRVNKVIKEVVAFE